MLRRALGDYERAAELSGRLPFITSALAGAYAYSGREAEARAICRELLDNVQRGFGLELAVAYVYEALGEAEQALEWLERAYQGRSPFLFMIGTEWLPFGSVRDHPRFVALLDKMGVAELARRIGPPESIADT